MSEFPANITRLIEAFARLPGVGEKTAQRLVFHLVRSPEAVSRELGAAASGLRDGLQFCRVCKNVTDAEVCSVCSDDRRDHGQILVVEEALDVLAFERAGVYRGVYHVLHGVLDPLSGIGPEQLTVGDLLARVQNDNPTEVIIATNPSTEGEATAVYLSRQLEESSVKISRLARGLPTGSELSYADPTTLSAAFAGRRGMD